MSASTDTTGHAIARVARLHRAAAERMLRRSGLHAGQELLMMALWERGALPQGELIELLGLDASTVTRMVQRLEQAGFVRRSRSALDRRAVIVEPTAAARALREQVGGIWRDLEQLTVAGLDSGERAELVRLLAAVERNLSA
ncbi:MarR family winged helix-turn-helix transcriptional regulator [Kitasatospora sp. NPDC006697]|uniref:MarR family winged helix-turn-helix transcriptional regulator n=1 Tax=Kitasatospora sp. NPDC006697 TaxID=3364020 RepID=UPI00367569FB